MEVITASSHKNTIEPQSIISLNKFIFLSFITAGLYAIWWSYKAWLFFKQKENTDILPAIRTIFSIVFLIPLLTKIIKEARIQGYQHHYSPTLLYIGYLFVVMLSYLPNPFWLVTTFAFMFFIPPFKALNFAKLNAKNYEVIVQKGFNGRQILLVIIGSIYWLIMLFAIYILLTEQNQYENY